MVNVTPRVGCPYLQGRTTDTFNEGFAFLGKNLAINNASVAGRIYFSRISTKAGTETFGFNIDVSTEGYTTITTNSNTAGSEPHFEIATGGSGAYAGKIILDSASTIQLESGSGSITVDSLINSSVSAGSPILKFTATSDSPTVVFGNGGLTNPSYVMSAAPAGYMEVDVGGTPYYMPFWA